MDDFGDVKQLLEEEDLLQEKSRKRTKEQSKILKECYEFLEWRWRWLFCLLFMFFIPVVILKPPKFVLWLLLNGTGFLYVAGVTCNRMDPIQSRESNHGARELVKLMLTIPLMYLIAPYWTLIDNEYDIVFFEGINGEKVKSSGFIYYFIYTWCCYIIPFFVGLHFTYLDYFPFLQAITITASELKKLRCAHWLFLFGVAVLISIFLAYHIYLFFQHQLIVWYGSISGILLVLFSCCWLYFVKRKQMRLHVHHFQIGAGLMAFTPFQNVVSSIIQGISAGIFVEGISRWGMDSTFKV